MAQPIRKGVKAVGKKTTIRRKKRDKPISSRKFTKKKEMFFVKDGVKIGTSKLEEKFAREFLDKLRVKYVRQWPMGKTGRFCDFAIEGHNILIEVDGDYYHGYGLLYEKMDAIQKHNNAVDRYKNQWALEHNFKMVRFWEHEIRKEPSKVMAKLKRLLGIRDKK